MFWETSAMLLCVVLTRLDHSKQAKIYTKAVLFSDNGKALNWF